MFFYNTICRFIIIEFNCDMYLENNEIKIFKIEKLYFLSMIHSIGYALSWIKYVYSL